MHFHRDVLAICDTFSRHVLRPSPDDVFTGTPPYAFTFGLGGVLLFPLHAGASTVLVEKATPVELAAIIDDFGVTTCFTAPTAYKAMLAAGAKLPSLRAAVSAGEHLPAATWQAFLDATGVRIIDGIGATEMLHIFIGRGGRRHRAGVHGEAVPGYHATVLDANGVEVPPGEPGRLAVKGPTGCRYLDDPRQSDYVVGGWNITGDTFTRDEAGYFYYQARSDDMIISSGYNIAAPEVEEALLKHPEVAECAVIGVPDEARGALVKAFVVLTDTSPGSRREGAPAAGLRQGADRAVQVPAGRRVPRRAPADGDRQAAAVQAPAGRVGTVEIAPRQLILSLYGLYAREEGDWLSVASLIALMADLGADSAAVRSSVSRLKRRGVLEAAQRDGRAGYALSPSTLEVLREGTTASGPGPEPRRRTAGWSWSSRCPSPSVIAGTPCDRCCPASASAPPRPVSGWRRPRCTTRPSAPWTGPA